MEMELDKVKTDYNSQLRHLRSQLATTAMEKQHQDSSCGQLEALLADSRRENKLLKVGQKSNPKIAHKIFFHNIFCSRLVIDPKSKVGWHTYIHNSTYGPTNWFLEAIALFKKS